MNLSLATRWNLTCTCQAWREVRFKTQDSMFPIHGSGLKFQVYLRPASRHDQLLLNSPRTGR